MKTLDETVASVLIGEAKKYKKADIEKAIELALSMSGSMTKASKAIEKIAKGLTDEKDVADALRIANESVEVTEAKVTVNVDWMGDVRDPDTSKVLKKYKIKAKEKGDTADLTGNSKDVAKYLQAVHHAGEYKTVQDLIDDGLYSELEESVVTEARPPGQAGRHAAAMDNLYDRVETLADDLNAYGKKDKSNKREIDSIVKQLDSVAYNLSQLAAARVESVEVTEASGGKEEYQKFFNSALEKFGVKSPAELDDEKKKEFFNYIDKNWEGKSEED